MGVSLIGCSSGQRTKEYIQQYIYVDNSSSPKEVKTDPNPNPYNFRILQKTFVNGNTVMMVNYPNCTTFGGNKLLLLKGDHTLTNFSELDPHFFEDDKHPIIARFKPTEEGIDLAMICAKNI